jgi:hypothetical protein
MRRNRPEVVLDALLARGGEMKHVADPATERVAERRAAAHHPSPTDPAQALTQCEVAEPTARPARPLSGTNRCAAQ